MPLTKRQRQILDYLQDYQGDHGYAPSFEEIAAHFNYNSLATVHEHLTNLERKGYIKRSYNESRAIEILPSEAFHQSVELPLLGAVAAGTAIEHSTSGETIAVPDDFVVLSGDDALTLPAMAVGARGIISVASNEVPSDMVQLVEAAESGDFSRARALHARDRTACGQVAPPDGLYLMRVDYAVK